MQHYLESTGSVERAQRKLCGMLECIRGIDRKKGVPQKVVLFARFLEYCEYEKALPLAMLDMTLQARISSGREVDLGFAVGLGLDIEAAEALLKCLPAVRPGKLPRSSGAGQALLRSCPNAA